ncbi:MAG: nucleotide-binding protein [Planctomycetes bacterium]|nr:nucleotide-binding protein [Planctomycetota bacterium]
MNQFSGQPEDDKVSGQSTQNVFQLFSNLRRELDSSRAEPWTEIENWIAKAKPFIRRYSPDDIDDFESLTKTPQWLSLPRLFQHADPVGSDRRSAEADKAERTANSATARDAKAKILRFLDSLIELQRHSMNVPPSNTAGRIEMAANHAKTMEPDPRNVFVVHGRNHKAVIALRDFLRRIGLNPLEWPDVVAATGKGSPYIGEVLEIGFQMARAIVVLMTGDDEAQLRIGLRGKEEPRFETELTPQPRPNVLIEAGMALGIDAKRTILVELGELRQVSDLLGRHSIRMNDTPEKRKELANRLQTAGCSVNLLGDDWIRNAGNSFQDALNTHGKYSITAANNSDLHFSDDVFWSYETVGGERVFTAHCPQCRTALVREIDFVKCGKCGFQEILCRRKPSKMPS